MDLRVEFAGRRLTIIHTGVGDWQDVHAAATDTADLAIDKSNVDQLLIDLSAAAPRLLDAEAEELADFFSSMLARFIRIAMVRPRDPDAIPITAAFVKRMNQLGHDARAFDLRDEAERFLASDLGERRDIPDSGPLRTSSLIDMFRSGPAKG